MTSDQGGRQGEPEGGQGGPGANPPPQGWDAPPPPPQGWAPPPTQGWNAPPPPPQGWNAPPPPQGWNAPPPGWEAQQQWGAQNPYGAPPPSGPVERPMTVRAGIGAFVVNFVLGLVASLVAFTDLDDLVREAARATDDPAITEDVLRTAILVGAVLGLVLVVLHALFIWWAWMGRNWARVVLFVLGGLSVVAGLASLSGTTGETGFLASMNVFQTLALVVGIVLLALQPSNEWYRQVGWLRANRR